MRTSFHHQPEAQHPNFQLLTSWQADYPIFWGGADMNDHMARTAPRAFDPKRTWIGLKSRSAAASCRAHAVLAATNKCLAQSNKSRMGVKRPRTAYNRHCQGVVVLRLK
jgi:hypothetical protein